MGCCGSKPPTDDSSSSEFKGDVRHGSQSIPNPYRINRPSDTNRRIVVALYDYDKRADTDISFRKDDRMEVLDDNGNAEWWHVNNLRSEESGWVPQNYVAPERSINSEDWYFENISRKEAESYLMVAENQEGTFLVRSSDHGTVRYHVLSLKVWETDVGYEIRHYKINSDERGFYVGSKRPHPTLQAFIDAYRQDAPGLGHVLKYSCPKPRPTIWELPDMHVDQYEIDRKKLKFDHRLGEGNFGEVFLAKWKKSMDVAVKTFRKGTMTREEFLQEANIMKQLRHQHLVALYGVCTKSEPIYIVQEYMSKGNLSKYLIDGEGQHLAFGDLIYIAAQVASGMQYLESKQSIHRDLAARNVLMGDNNLAKIGDFGLARIIENEYNQQVERMLPIKWTAPESIRYGKFTIKSDVWSFGILLMELFTYGQKPYLGMTNQDVIKKVNAGYRMPKPFLEGFPDDMYHQMLQCWDANPERRPTFEFLSHYFQGFAITSEFLYRDVDED